MIGCAAGMVITFASASSGPMMSLIIGILALSLWKFKQHTRTIRHGAIVLYILLIFVMNKPPYHLIGRIDLSGGSTGFHRVLLIQQTIAYLSEWWLFGTDFTRHWMPNQGYGLDPNHTDITNYYIGFGVDGGLIGMLLVMLMMAVAFHWVGQIHDEQIADKPDQSFMIWCFGASLFSHAVTSISVAYFDQSMLYFWLNVAVISSIHSIVHLKRESGMPITKASESGDRDDHRALADREAIALANAEWRRRMWNRSQAKPRGYDGRP